MSRPRPFRDSTLDGKPPPQHVWPYAWWGSADVACTRCRRKVSEIERCYLPCVTDAQMAKAEVAGNVFARLRRAG